MKNSRFHQSIGILSVLSGSILFSIWMMYVLDFHNFYRLTTGGEAEVVLEFFTSILMIISGGMLIQKARFSIPFNLISLGLFGYSTISNVILSRELEEPVLQMGFLALLFIFVGMAFLAFYGSHYLFSSEVDRK